MAEGIQGLERLNKRLDDMSSNDRLTQSLQKACALVERTAKQTAPKDTGALRNSIASKVEGSEGIIFTNLEYAPYVEYGTGIYAEKGGRTTPWKYKDAKGVWHITIGQKPQPYMRPALYENKDEILKILREAIK